MSSRLIGKDLKVHLSGDYRPTCAVVSGDMVANLTPKTVLTEVTVVANPRNTDETGKITSWDILDFAGQTCGALKSNDNTTPHERVPFRDETIYKGSRDWPATARKWVFKCEGQSVIAEAGISANLDHLNFRCQDVQSEEAGSQMSNAILYNEDGTAMLDDFIFGTADAPIQSRDDLTVWRTRCENGDLPVGINKSFVDNKLNSLTFECAKMPVPLPTLVGEPEPVAQQDGIATELPAGNPLSSAITMAFLIPVIIGVVVFLIIVGAIVGIVFGVKHHNKKKAAALAAKALQEAAAAAGN
jgi:hypothetical protein